MKFLQLKEALEQVLPEAAPEPVRARAPELPSIPFYNPGARRQTVVGGALMRTPVDRTAALVVSKAPWWAQPPVEAVKIETKQPSKERKRPMSIHRGVSNSPAVAHGAETVEKKPNDVFNVEIATEAIKRTKDSLDGIRQLVDQAQDARAALDVLCDYWKAEWVEFMGAQDQRLRELRMTRMAFEVETKVLMASLKDVRAFFLDKNHDAEVGRLREFVDLCERLQKLKQSGFLDTVADTILKLT